MAEKKNQKRTREVKISSLSQGKADKDRVYRKVLEDDLKKHGKPELLNSRAVKARLTLKKRQAKALMDEKLLKARRKKAREKKKEEEKKKLHQKPKRKRHPGKHDSMTRDDIKKHFWYSKIMQDWDEAGGKEGSKMANKVYAEVNRERGQKTMKQRYRQKNK